MKAVKAKCKFEQENIKKKFHERVLSSRVFSSDGHYGLMVCPRMNTIALSDQFKVHLTPNFFSR